MRLRAAPVRISGPGHQQNCSSSVGPSGVCGARRRSATLVTSEVALLRADPGEARGVGGVEAVYGDVLATKAGRPT